MILKHQRTEEGQVYPALLLAIFGAFGLAVLFVSFQNLMDQGSRADTAADASALAVGKQHRDHLLTSVIAGMGFDLVSLPERLAGAGVAPGATDAAERYASANGAEVVRVDYRGFDLGQRRWIYEVSTRQRDTVRGGGESARLASTSKVAVQMVGGVCADLSGVVIGGQCKPFLELLQDCTPPPPPPPPPPGSEPDPPEDDEDEEEEEPWEAPGFCDLDLGSLLNFKITLIS